MKFDRDKFLTAFNKGFGSATTGQRQGIDYLLGKVESDPAWGKPLDLRLVAYFLATIYWETARTFRPISEMRAKPGTKVRALQDRYWSSGYYGRGYVQITWEKNYAKFDIANDPAKALEPETAYHIASQGMLKGLFTGHRLTAYAEDPVGARQVINGKDKAEEIAAIARKIQACLSLSISKEPASEPVKQEPAETSPTPTPVKASSRASLVDRIKTAMVTYKATDEGLKALVGRVLQKVWIGIAGLVAMVQKNPIKIGIAVLVLVLGFIVLHYYVKRQDIKTFLKLGGKT